MSCLMSTGVQEWAGDGREQDQRVEMGALGLIAKANMKEQSSGLVRQLGGASSDPQGRCQ